MSKYCACITGTYQSNLTSLAAMNEQYECPDSTGPYIRISECITGIRAQVIETTVICNFFYSEEQKFSNMFSF